MNTSKIVKLDADPKATQQIELVGKLKKLNDNGNATDIGADQNMFVLTILVFNKLKSAVKL